MALRTGSLSDAPRRLGSTSGALRREAERLRKEGFGSASERLALAGGQAAIGEDNITSAESNAEEEQLRRQIRSGLLRTQAQQLRESANPASVARATAAPTAAVTAPTTAPQTAAARTRGSGIPFADVALETARAAQPTQSGVYQARDASPLTTRVLDRSRNPAGFASGDEAIAQAAAMDDEIVGDEFKPEGDFTLVGSRKGFPVYRSGKNIDAASRQAAAISDRLMRR